MRQKSQPQPDQSAFLRVRGVGDRAPNMIETIETTHMPLLKRSGSPQSTRWSSSSLSSATSSSYGAARGGLSHLGANQVGWEGNRGCAISRDEEEKDGASSSFHAVTDGRSHRRDDAGTSPPSGCLPPSLCRSSSDGWSRSHSSKPPRQKYPTIQNMAFPILMGGNEAGVNINGTNLHVCVRFDALGNPPTEERSRGRHRRTYSVDFDTHVSRHKRGGSRGRLNSFSDYTLSSESIKLLPDPRWGMGAASLSPPPSARSRTFSGSSLQSASNIVSYSRSTDSECVPPALEITEFGGGGFGYYGSTNANAAVNGVAQSPPKGHRHHTYSVASGASSAHASFASFDRSIEPVMTNMTKSAMFKGITNMGVMKLQLPKDNFRLLIDRDLESGCVYRRTLVENEDEYFRDYHTSIDDGFEPTPLPPQLPPLHYVMAVGSDIYRRIFDEVAESMNMPCGLFYFGHHADVEYPSIAIAIVGVMIVLLLMLWATIYVDG